MLSPDIFVIVEPSPINVPLALIFHTTSSFSVGAKIPIPTFPNIYTALRGFVPSTNFAQKA